ncbi:EAL domain-containing protein [Vibrio paucivorans]
MRGKYQIQCDRVGEITVLVYAEELQVEVEREGQRKKHKSKLSKSESEFIGIIGQYGAKHTPISSRYIEARYMEVSGTSNLPLNFIKNTLASVRRKFSECVFNLTGISGVKFVVNINRSGYFLNVDEVKSPTNYRPALIEVDVDKYLKIKAVFNSIKSEHRRIAKTLGLSFLVSLSAFFLILLIQYYYISSEIQKNSEDVVGTMINLTELSCSSDDAMLMKTLGNSISLESALIKDVDSNDQCMVTEDSVERFQSRPDKWYKRTSSYLYISRINSGHEVHGRIRLKSINSRYSRYLSPLLFESLTFERLDQFKLSIGNKVESRAVYKDTINTGLVVSYYGENIILEMVLLSLVLFSIIYLRKAINLTRYIILLFGFSIKLEGVINTNSMQVEYYEALSLFKIGGRNTQGAIGFLRKSKLLSTHTIITLEVLSKAEEQYGSIGFNLCPSILLNDHHFSNICRIIMDSDKLFVIEVTEDSKVSYSDKIVEKINLLSGLENVKIAIDDFGQGNNNVGLLNVVNASYIKIDKKITQDTSSNNYKDKITKIIELANSFGVDVIFEGVEDKNIKSMLGEGAVFQQGYYYNRG